MKGHACLIALALMASANAHAINKCKDASGKISYQDAPCAGTSKTQVLRVPQKAASETASSTGGSPAAPAGTDHSGTPASLTKSMNRDALLLAAVHATLEICAKLDASGGGNYSAAMKKWRTENAEALKQHENSEQYQQVLQRVRQENSGNQSEAARNSLRAMCEQQILPLF
ncbi:DUF4124 domain-containing protein [Hydrogenophaga sp. 5NK40-0174]|uniref:DUF4124 domain-containing protein n=1 Tax=Hydrogenophaga sp. 5NK40-0174 TaxID=3127649 RepID=UPI00310AE715